MWPCRTADERDERAYVLAAIHNRTWAVRSEHDQMWVTTMDGLHRLPFDHPDVRPALEAIGGVYHDNRVEFSHG